MSKHISKMAKNDERRRGEKVRRLGGINGHWARRKWDTQLKEKVLGIRKFYCSIEVNRGKHIDRIIKARSPEEAAQLVNSIEGWWTMSAVCSEVYKKEHKVKRHCRKAMRKEIVDYPDDINAFGMSYSDLPQPNRPYWPGYGYY